MKPIIKFAADQACNVQGCGTTKYAWGFCVKHYQRMKRRGSTDPFTVEDRFWSKVEEVGECWIWTGSVTEKGYGLAWNGSKNVPAHRLAYTWMVGDIPKGLQLDHLCHGESVVLGECEGGYVCVHRRCVNPEHLDPVTNEINVRRGLQVQRLKEKAVKRTHCHKGHEYNLENTYYYSTGRQCKICTYEARRARGK